MKKILVYMACIALLGSLAGCGLMGSDTPPPPTYGPVAEFVIAQNAGSSTVVDDPEFGNAITVIIQDTFYSASGEECKRATLLAQDKQAEIVAMCRKGTGPWTMAPRIWGQGL
ncbi:MAG: DVU3141 family protein [Desulfovibrionaceae bacterium]